jgi:hypothetical protein
MDFDDSSSDSSLDYLTGEEDLPDLSDEDDDAVQQDANVWHLVNSLTDLRASDPHEFHGTPGVNPGWQAPQQADGNEAAFLSLFLTDEMFGRIAEWTNARVWETYEEGAEEDNVPKLVMNWKDCSSDDIRKVVGIVLLMGLDKKPEVSDYWSNDPVFHCNFLSQEFSLSRDRFKQIISRIRFYDCNQISDDSSISKIQPFLSLVQGVCQSSYMPQQNLSVDETLVHYKGRLEFKQHIPSKKSRYGVKIYCLCESQTGYLWNFAIHTLAQQNAKFGEGLGCDHLSLSERIVAELCKDVLDLGHRVFTDTWFTSRRLADWLLTRQTSLTGTIRKNRGIPELLQEVHLRPTSSAFARLGDVLACKFVDRRSSGIKTVYLLDTAGVADCVDVQRIRRGNRRQIVSKPAIAIAYTRSMGGVDTMDSAVAPYLANRKTLHWFNKVAFHLIVLLVRNSWIVYRECGGSLKLLEYIRKAISILVEQTGRGRRRLRGTTRVRGAAVGPAGDALHSPTKVARGEGRRRPRDRCRLCRTRKSIYVCDLCPESPALCLGECFSRWHER